MPQFTVHLLIPIKVELEVEADTAEAAIVAADKAVDADFMAQLERVVDNANTPLPRCRSILYCDDGPYKALVDHPDDPDFRQSTWYDEDALKRILGDTESGGDDGSGANGHYYHPYDGGR